MSKATATTPDLDALSKALISAVGANDEETEPKLWLDMGYKPLNKLLSGQHDRGLPGGRMIEIFGPSASGKTLLATAAMIAAQKAGGIAVFIDWERTFNATFATMLGMNCTDQFVYKRSETWEEGNTIAMRVAETVRTKKLIAPEAPIVMVCDSIAAALPRSMLYDKDGKRKEISEFTMNDTTALARVTSTTLKAVNQLVGDFDVTAVYLNQIRTKPGVVYGDPTTTPGGSAMEFYATTRLATGRKRVLDTDKEMIGAEIGIETKKNKIARPFESISLRLGYADDGTRTFFDYAMSYINDLVASKKLEEKAGRVTWDGKTYFKAQLAKKINDEGRISELEAIWLS